MTIIAIEQGEMRVGARPFFAVGAGHRPDEVFIRLRHEALVQHAGDDSGTIAAKCGYQLLRRDRQSFAQVLQRNHRLGPAWCLPIAGEQDCAWFPEPIATAVREALTEARAGNNRLFAFFGYAADTRGRPASASQQAGPKG